MNLDDEIENLARKQTIQLLVNAEIPKLYRSMRLPDMGANGKRLRAYLEVGGENSTDFANGIGLFIHGPARNRPDLFSVFAKECVLSGYRHLALIPMRSLVTALTTDSMSEYAATLSRQTILCIQHFQQDVGECPYSWSERSRVEQFVSTRLQGKNVTHFSAAFAPQECAWWSVEFRNLIEDRTTNILCNK